MKSNQIKKMVINAMLIALHYVLCFFSISIPVPPTKIVFTIAGLPVVLAGLMMGPVSGLTVGLVGSFINQMWGKNAYGLTLTTPLWILPTALLGLVCGLYARKHDFRLSLMQQALIIMLGTILVTTLNIVANYVDSRIYHWPYKIVLFKSALDYAVDVAKGFVYSALLTPLISALEKSGLVRGMREYRKKAA